MRLPSPLARLSALLTLMLALAGGFFAMLYVVRGFGVTVGAHAAYDLLVNFPGAG